MKLSPNDYFPGANGLCHLQPGPCGPVYVNQIWTEEQTIGDFYYNQYIVPGPRKTLWKVELECENPEVLNSILGQIKNTVACPYNEEPKINARLTRIGVIDKEEDLPDIANIGDYYYDKKGVAYIWLGSWNTIPTIEEDPIEKITSEFKEDVAKTINDGIVKILNNTKYKLKHRVLYHGKM